MRNLLMEALQLQYQYPDGTKALDTISFQIAHGETVGIVGANGAGKSTLLLHLCGVLFPTAGSVRVGELLLSKQTVGQIRRVVGLSFQNPDDQLFMPTVYDDVAFGPVQWGYSSDEVKSLTCQALERVGIWHLKDRPPYKLSGGEKRLAALAAVLAILPDILLLDEPSAALDPLARRRLIQLLGTLQHTQIIASHDLDLVVDVCDRTIVLAEGKVIADGPTLRILNDATLLERARLEKPLRMQACPVCNP